MKRIEVQEWESIDKTKWKMNGNFSMDNQIIRKIIHDCGTTAYAVYSLILSHRNSKTNQCNPSLDLIAQECSTTSRTVSRDIKILFENGFLDVNSGLQGNNNEYFFPLESFYQDFIDDPRQSQAKKRISVGEKKEMKPVSGIYLIENTVNGKKYVGQAVNIRTRWVQHIQELRNNKHCNKDLQADFNKYGEDVFDFKVLEIVEDSPVLDIELDRKENKWGKEYNVLEEGYNKAEFIDPFK